MHTYDRIWAFKQTLEAICIRYNSTRPFNQTLTSNLSFSILHAVSTPQNSRRSGRADRQTDRQIAWTGGEAEVAFDLDLRSPRFYV